MENFCPACKSVHENGFASVEQPENQITTDVNPELTDVGKTVYKSSQFPTSADDFAHVRQACVKSLSNEV